MTQLVMEGKPRTVIDPVLHFCTQVGLPITLAEIGLSADMPRQQLEQVAARATAEGETIHNEPFAVSPDIVADAILAADAMGRAWRDAAAD